MTDATRLALARVQVADIVCLCNRRLNAAGYQGAAHLLTYYAMEIADELARKSAQAAEFNEAQIAAYREKP